MNLFTLNSQSARSGFLRVHSHSHLLFHPLHAHFSLTPLWSSVLTQITCQSHDKIMNARFTSFTTCQYTLSFFFSPSLSLRLSFGHSLSLMQSCVSGPFCRMTHSPRANIPPFLPPSLSLSLCKEWISYSASQTIHCLHFFQNSPTHTIYLLLARYKNSIYSYLITLTSVSYWSFCI